MSKSVSKRIEKVKTEHAELLNMIKEKISENNEHFQNHTNEVLAVLEYDEQNVKKYEATVQAQELVASLTQQILEAKDMDEIIAIRKKLNYYINKIKSELKRRGVTETVILNYQGHANDLRKSIAKYIRFFKREENICEIDRLASNYDNLSSEELTNLKKCLSREIRYTTRNINSFNEEKHSSTHKVEGNKKVIDTPRVETISSVNNNAEVATPKDEISSIDNNIAEIATSKDETSIIDTKNMEPCIAEEIAFKEEKIVLEETIPQISKKDFDELETGNNDDDLMFVTGELPYEELSKYLASRIDSFGQMYDIVQTHDYNQKGFGKNVLNFFRNIPLYIHNKKAIQKMIKDYLLFYRGGDLSSFIEYMKRKNSIKENLKCIFDNSTLYTKDEAYLNEHDNCARWMYDFCQKKSLTLCVNKIAA